MLKVVETSIPDLLVLEPKVFGDARGFFLENYNRRQFLEYTGLDVSFVQDNLSRSQQNVLRGMHYQINQPQGKLVSVVRGRIFDVAVDFRKSKPTFGQWFGIELNEDNHQQVWIPPGFAHGFVVLSKKADILYKTTNYYSPQDERCVSWDDPEINIEWPHGIKPTLSDKDMKGGSFLTADYFP